VLGEVAFNLDLVFALLVRHPRSFFRIALVRCYTL